MKKLLITLLATSTLATSTLAAGTYAYAHNNNNTTTDEATTTSMDKHSQKHSPREHKAKHAKKHLKRMAKALDLSYDQIEAIKALHEQARAERPERSQGLSINQLNPFAADYSESIANIAAQKAAAVESAILKRAELHAQVFAILTPEQQEQALQLAAERSKRKR